MNSKGKLYVKHLEKAKYVVKGRKLKSDIAIVTKKDTSSNVIMTCKDLTEKIGCLYPTSNIKYMSESKYSETSYSEADFEINDESDEKVVLDFEMSDNDIEDSSVVSFVPVNDDMEIEEKVDEKIEKVLAKIAEEKEFYAKEDLSSTNKSLKLDDCGVIENSIVEIDEEYAKGLEAKQKEIKVATEAEISKEQVESKIKELKAKEKSANKRNKQQKQDIDSKIGNIVTEEEITRGIVNEKKETVSQSQLDELERLRLLELARVKKESLDKEKIEKAKAKKEEKIKQEEKNKQENAVNDEKKVVQLKEVKEAKEVAKKKARKSETRSFTIVAALLAIVIVAGMANIGGSLVDQISKDNMLVGEADESKTNNEQPSLIQDLYQNINNTFNKEDDAQKTTKEPIGIVEDDTVVVADGSGNKTQENKGGTMVENEYDVLETLEDSKLPTAPMQPLPEDDIPIVNPGEETGAVEDEETVKYVEIQYSATGFKLYNTSKNSVTRTQVLGGECKEYTKYKVSGGNIQIPKDESQGLWFIVKDGKVEVEFSFKQGNAQDAASLILMKIEEGVETEEEVIYAQRGSTVDLGGTYYTRDDEGNKIEEKTSVSNVIGKIILFKK